MADIRFGKHKFGEVQFGFSSVSRLNVLAETVYINEADLQKIIQLTVSETIKLKEWSENRKKKADTWNQPSGHGVAYPWSS